MFSVVFAVMCMRLRVTESNEKIGKTYMSSLKTLAFSSMQSSMIVPPLNARAT